MFDPNAPHDVWPNVKVASRRRTKNDKPMVEIQWMGGSQSFFDEVIFNGCQEGQTVTIKANYQEMETKEGGSRRFYDGFEVEGGADASAFTGEPPKRSRRAAA